MQNDHSLNLLKARPTVVIDRVSMQYQVASTHAETATTSNRLSRLRRGASTITVHALNEMSLVVSHGESVGIIGRNGSGKSTLTRLISGRTRPTSGSIFASDTPIMLGVNAALLPDLAGDQNVILGCLAMGMDRRTIAEKFDDIVEVSGLGDSIYLPMKSYSSGMASRLRFAIATSVDPEILLIDEALNTGDAQFRERSRSRISQLRDHAGTVFLVSHSLGTITEMCTRVIWLDGGDLLMDGDVETVTSTYSRFTSFLSNGDHASAQELRYKSRESLIATQVLERTTGRRSA
ncbi:ABC transporter ATP-binding protein [Arthrobacter parietis]|uniref:ABC transporter ATP-binding protein n=1 Tax=Arthrobacter parietis TaxID=271434 RepID=A0ABP5MSW3_9MICC